jgi:hypothetical protein
MIGDPLSARRGVSWDVALDVARTFGEGFARQLAPWNEAVAKGPLHRALECTFVFIDERAKGSMPPLGSLWAAVHRQRLNAHRIEAEEKLYRTLSATDTGIRDAQ